MTTRRPIAGLLVLACCNALSAAPAPPPVELFFQDAALVAASLSPDGRHVIARASFKGLRNALVLIDLASMQPKVLARYANGDVGQVFWLSDKRIGYTVINIDPAYRASGSGLYALNWDGSGSKGLRESVVNQRSFADGTALQGPRSNPSQLEGRAGMDAYGMFVIVNWEGGRQELGLLDTRSAETSVIAQPEHSFSWLMDDAGLRMTLAVERDKHSMHLLGADAKWRKLATFAPASAESLLPRAVAGGALYVEAQGGADRVSLYRYNTDKLVLEQPPVITSPDFDISGGAVMEGQRLLGYRINTDAESTVWFDPQMKAVQEEVDALLPHLTNRIERASASQTPFVLVSSYSPADPGDTFIYNRDSKKLTKLGTALPGLDRSQLSTAVDVVRYKARDGMSIPAYVTLPTGAVQKNLPTIVFAGAYPWQRNGSWSFDPAVQLLATRGYAVIQPDARGARGFGAAHFKAGFKQWGLAMQDDLADGARWAIAQGIADPKRICIIGTVYGGYAAMMGVLKDPGLFKCAVSWAGIVDINLMFKHRWEEAPVTAHRDDMKLLVGDPGKDLAQFNATSPLLAAQRITRPVLLAYGARDVEVPGKHGRQLFDAIKPGNPDAEFMWFDEKGQPASLEANRAALWTRIEQFLAKHIGKP